MNRLSILLFALLTFSFVRSSDHPIDDRRKSLPGASFFIAEATGSPFKPTMWSYYNYQGEFLGAFLHERNLDPEAPAPKITNCEYSPQEGEKPERIIFTVGESAQRLMFTYNRKTGEVSGPQKMSVPWAILLTIECFEKIQGPLGIDTSNLSETSKENFFKTIDTYKQIEAKRRRKEQGESGWAIM